MKRFILVLAVGAVMAMLVVAMAAPAMAARGSEGIVGINLGTSTLTVAPNTIQQDPRSVALPTDPILPVDPIRQHNPNVV
jgi:xanthosine utilization system XapX-like protein